MSTGCSPATAAIRRTDPRGAPRSNERRASSEPPADRTDEVLPSADARARARRRCSGHPSDTAASRLDPPVARRDRCCRRGRGHPRRSGCRRPSNGRTAPGGQALAAQIDACRGAEAARRHPPDPARRRDHAGEPIVRLLLRHLPPRRRDPDEERRPDRLHPRLPDGAMRQAVPRRERPQLRRPARASLRGHRHRPRQDGRLHRVRPASRPAPLPALDRTDLPTREAGSDSRRDGVPRRPRDPQLLGVRPSVRPAGSHVPVGRVLEPARAPLPRLGVVGEVHPEGAADELSHGGGESGRAARRAAEHDGRDPALRLDRSHLSAAQAPRQLALLRPPGRRAGLQDRVDVLQDDLPGRGHARDLEPPPLVHDRCAGSPAARHQAVPRVRLRRPGGGASRCLLDRPLAGDQRPSDRARQPRSGVRHRRRQRDHGEPRLELDRHLPHVGRLGRLLRSRTPTGRRRLRLRHAGPGPRDQPVREAGVRRPPDAELRCVPEVHRGRLPRRRAHQPANRRTPRLPSAREGEPEAPGRSRARLRLLATAAEAAHPPAVSPRPKRRP